MTISPAPTRINILGTALSALNIPLALDTFADWIARDQRQYVCVCPVNNIMDAYDQPDLRRIFNRAGLVTPDGMPLVWLARLRGFKAVRRVYGPDLMLAACELAARKGYGIYLYGGAPGVPERLSQRLLQRFPTLRIVGIDSPPFRPLSPQEDAAAIERINRAAPQIVWVGLGSPKQDRWMASHRAALTAPILVGVGAAFDFHAGVKPQAPPWMRRSGLEWLFRLASEPRRMWRRYLYNNPRFVILALAQWLGLRRYPMDGLSPQEQTS